MKKFLEFINYSVKKICDLIYYLLLHKSDLLVYNMHTSNSGPLVFYKAKNEY